MKPVAPVMRTEVGLRSSLIGFACVIPAWTLSARRRGGLIREPARRPPHFCKLCRRCSPTSLTVLRSAVHMTPVKSMLSRKIILQNLALLAGLTALGIASLVGLLRVNQQVGVAVDEYKELRLLETAALHTSAARGLLLAGTAHSPVLRSEIDAAVRTLRTFEQLQAEMQEGSESHEDEEGELAQHAIACLEGIGSTSATDRQAAITAIDTVLANIHHLAADADALVGKLQGRAARNVRNTLLTISGVFAAVILAAVVISVRQYRGVMRPLNALRQGVRTMASGNFTSRVAEDGDREFADLAHDYNRMAQELDGLYRGLEEKVAAKSRELVQSERLASVGFLAAGVAHEINNPLNIISGYSELSLKRLRRTRDGEALADAEKSLQIIREEAFRCKAITEKLLSLSKPGDGARETISMGDVAQDVVQMMGGHKRFADRRLLLQHDTSASSMVQANENEMKQVLLNLVANALEATEPGRGEVRVDVARSNGWVEVRVADNGAGMAPQVRDHVFEPFFSSRPAGGPKGTGLGLSISHAIVTSHNGRIRAESDGSGKGSQFIVQLPAYVQGVQG